ncbi:nuclear transport factor 2 family protein [Algoriphagus halophytocola]|uniref:Nuclear transport factor 2 family protein n=1 Tax=Algoriphagus halophytocola TaxID=2991499 RepID=A0ABY6MIU5_9BACT|nr:MULTISPECIES: nuclear transport factor 2 family protein [unclassified Algoriphagus]UZD22904.1 nuclear transport factor 2 family protein [Algoriphagus sp. TR-M5]WBL44172.1 nuclear transport factor 2 family protein [Algoriphagus sp. TR-M9]
MTKIISHPNCGNSPKMEFLKAFNIAFAKGDTSFLIESVTDDMLWDIVGDKKILGKKAFGEELEQVNLLKVEELRLEQILSHGKEGAANGVMKMENGKRYAFADFYVFQGAKGLKVKAITSYCLEV